MALCVGSWVVECRGNRSRTNGRCGVMMSVSARGSWAEVLTVSTLHLSLKEPTLKTFGQIKIHTRFLKPFHGTRTCDANELNSIFVELLSKDVEKVEDISVFDSAAASDINEKQTEESGSSVLQNVVEAAPIETRDAHPQEKTMQHIAAPPTHDMHRSSGWLDAAAALLTRPAAWSRTTQMSECPTHDIPPQQIILENAAMDAATTSATEGNQKQKSGPGLLQMVVGETTPTPIREAYCEGDFQQGGAIPQTWDSLQQHTCLDHATSTVSNPVTPPRKRQRVAKTEEPQKISACVRMRCFRDQHVVDMGALPKGRISRRGLAVNWGRTGMSLTTEGFVRNLRIDRANIKQIHRNYVHDGKMTLVIEDAKVEEDNDVVQAAYIFISNAKPAMLERVFEELH